MAEEGSNLKVIKLQGTNNYATWRVNVKALLTIKGLARCITGEDNNADNDAKARAYLLLSLTDTLQLALAHYDTAQELWDRLDNMFRQQSAARRLMLRKQLHNLDFTGTDTIVAYMSRVRSLSSDLAAAGDTLTDQELVEATLAGIKKSSQYTNTVDLLLDKEDVTLDEVESKLLLAEQRDLVTNDKPAVSAFVATAPPNRTPGGSRGRGRGGRGPGRSGGGGGRGTHTGGGSSGSNDSGAHSAGKRIGNQRCYFCGAKGHKVAECRKKQAAYANAGSSGGSTGGNSGGNTRTSAVAFMTVTTLPSTDPSVWILDSGATYHYTPHTELLSDLRRLDTPITVTVGNGAKVCASFAGDITIKLLVDNKYRTVTLTNVLHIPELTTNLFSVKQAAANGATVLFDSDTATVLHQSVRIIQGTAEGGVYTFRAAYPGWSRPSSTAFALVARAEGITAEQWHRRMAHLSYGCLATLVDNDLVTGIHVPGSAFKEAGQRHVCEGCIMGKHPRAPFRVARSPSSGSTGRVHMDLVGPLEVTGFGGSRYALHMLHEDTGLSLHCALASKDQVPATAIRALNLLGKQGERMGHVVSKLRTDNGSEFVNSKMADYCAEKGILHERSAPYTPQQNGAAERLNRTLVERGRAMLLDADMDKQFWPLAMAAASYVRNRSPTAAGGKTPYELFTGIKPDLSGMRTFGCLAYAHVPKDLRYKLDPKSERGIMVGYAAGGKAYHILVGKRIITSRDVVFDEQVRGATLQPFPPLTFHIPPAHSSTSAPTTPDPSLAPPARVNLPPPLPAGPGAMGGGLGMGHGTAAAGSSDSEAESSFMTVLPDDDWEAPLAPAAAQPAAPALAAGPHAGQPAAPAAPAGRYPLRSRLRGSSPAGVAAAAAPAAPAAPDAAGPGNVADRAEGSTWGGRLRDAPDPNRPKVPYYMRQAQAQLAAAFDWGPEPRTVAEALAGPEAPFWQQAMNEEIASLHTNNTWELLELPEGSKALPCMWIFKRKLDAAGNIERYKARLVVKGFLQREGIDYNEVYAPTSKHTTLRALLAKVASENLELHQLDVKTAFLNGELEETIYMKQPPGYEEGSPTTVCLLRKALYGLKQAPRAWHTKLKAELENLGFVASDTDPGLFTMAHPTAGTVFILVYVDDMLLAGSNDKVLDGIETALKKKFDVHDKGDASVFVGMEIKRDRAAGTLTISQRRMTAELVTKYGMDNAASKYAPLPSDTKLSASEGELLDKSVSPYCELVGSLLYIAVCSRPDITQAVGALSRYMAKPTTVHWNLARGVVQYLGTTVDYGITFGGGTGLLGYCDSDFAGDKDTRRSTTGYVFVFNGGAISWSSRLQPTVAVSTAEAEYMSAGAAVKEALWLRKLMSDLQIPVSPVNILCDNQAALALLKNPITSARSKHIDVLHHFARERVARKEVEFSYCESAKMVADCMTKPLSKEKIKACCSGMGMG